MIPPRGLHARRPGWGVAVGAGLLALLLIAAILVYAGSRGRSPQGEAAPAPGVQEPAPTLEPPALDHWPRWGVTHTQFSADNESAGVQEQARGLLGREPMLQNQHIMGWGAGNPEPAPGQYNLHDLNRRLSFVSSAKGVPIITLCCAPDWMKGGETGRTDWDKNATVAPDPEHFDDFAALAVRVARQYPTVKHFLVWNELKGFWNDSANRWDAEGYTAMYNKVYDALKKHDPAIQVGGPYVSLDSHARQVPGAELSGPWGSVEQRGLDAVKYWLEHREGADFVVVDAWSTSLEGDQEPDAFTALGKFSAITRWLGEKSGGLPVWWAEWYVEPENSGWDETKRTAVQAAAMMEFAASGVATALYWNPQRRAGEACAGCLWEPGTGGERPMAGLLSGFVKWFPAGVEARLAKVSDRRVKALAQQRMVVMINTTAQALTATVAGERVTLKPYEVRWSPRV